jgi:anti-anti-sigma factor
MSIQTEIRLGVLFIKINGRFDFSVHHDFREAIKLAETDIKQVEVDLANTDYLDSSALGMLLVLRERMASRKEAVLIRNAKNDVKKIIEIANFDKLFTLT